MKRACALQAIARLRISCETASKRLRSRERSRAKPCGSERSRRIRPTAPETGSDPSVPFFAKRGLTPPFLFRAYSPRVPLALFAAPNPAPSEPRAKQGEAPRERAVSPRCLVRIVLCREQSGPRPAPAPPQQPPPPQQTPPSKPDGNPAAPCACARADANLLITGFPLALARGLVRITRRSHAPLPHSDFPLPLRRGPLH